jgi:hypothetical protein
MLESKLLFSEINGLADALLTLECMTTNNNHD